MGASKTRAQEIIFSEKTAPGFSVIIPSFNHARFIRDAIDSVLSQGYKNVEVIVVDGGSTDGTVDILSSYGDCIRWLSEKDEGQSDALAKGFALATQEWLTWLNSDDIQTNQALHRVSEAIERYPGAQVIVGQGHYMDEAGRYVRSYPTIAIGPNINIAQELFEKGYLAQPSVYFHRAAYQAVGGIDRTMQFTMDYDLWVRLARHGCPFASVDADISGNRWHESAKTASSLLALMSEAVAVQLREYRRVSPYFVQAISDHLYSTIHALRRGDQHHLFYRQLYFKTVWVWLNCHRPLYCLGGVLTQNIAKSGPLVGDKLTVAEMIRLLFKAFKRKLPFFSEP